MRHKNAARKRKRSGFPIQPGPAAATAYFEILYAFIILDLGRREIVSFGVTCAPSAQYAAQSFVEAVCDREYAIDNTALAA